MDMNGSSLDRREMPREAPVSSVAKREKHTHAEKMGESEASITSAGVIKAYLMFSIINNPPPPPPRPY